jgi:hypothetical protein
MNGVSGQSTTTVSIPDLSRVAFFDGERLAAVDLNEAASVQRELRWLHNRSLHSWGIALGFAISGAKGDQHVQVGPGYAVDCLGREIILTETLTKVVPARADNGQGKPVTYFLVASYPDDNALTVLEERQGECGTSGAVRLRERASIYWKAQVEQPLQTGFELVLAQAQVQNCQLAAAVSVDQRRSARPPQQPFVAAGATPAGGTTWQTLIAKGAVGADVIIGLHTEVDTTEARFSSAPVYQAVLAGSRYIRGTPLPQTSIYMLDGTTSISAATRNRFTFNVLMPHDLLTFTDLVVNPAPLFQGEGSPDTLLKLGSDNWWVEWVGMEG